MNSDNIKKIITKITLGPSKWELDSITYSDRYTNPKTLISFFERIQLLESKKTKITKEEKEELTILLELLEEMDEEDIEELLVMSDEDHKTSFIEDLARKSAIEVLTNGKLGFETMNTACKLSPNDFILCAKRTQDIINSIQGLVIKGETLSKDIAGA
jgi:hypothetical protein